MLTSQKIFYIFTTEVKEFYFIGFNRYIVIKNDRARNVIRNFKINRERKTIKKTIGPDMVDSGVFGLRGTKSRRLCDMKFERIGNEYFEIFLVNTW